MGGPTLESALRRKVERDSRYRLFADSGRVTTAWFMSRQEGGKHTARPLQRAYLRDGRAPVPVSEATSRVMRANRPRNTSPEVRFRRALKAEGVRGFRSHPRAILGRPDVAFLDKRVAVFVNGCFWHRCPNCNPPLPKTHTEFWQKKFDANRARDSRIARRLREDNWRVFVIWECRVHRNQSHEARRVASALAST